MSQGTPQGEIIPEAKAATVSEVAQAALTWPGAEGTGSAVLTCLHSYLVLTHVFIGSCFGVFGAQLSKMIQVNQRPGK